MDDPDQTAPVEHADKPVCGTSRHNHPYQRGSQNDCLIALLDHVEEFRETSGPNSGMRTPLGFAVVDEVLSRPVSDRAAMHRAMCEPRYTSPRDVRKALEIEACTRERATHPKYNRQGR